MPGDGRLSLELFARGIALQAGERSLFDRDGTSLVIHAGPDGYMRDPAGDAGDRLACGVLTR